MVGNGVRTTHYGTTLNRREVFNDVPKRKQVKMETMKEVGNEGSFRLKAQFNRRLNRVTVQLKLGKDGGKEIYMTYLLGK